MAYLLRRFYKDWSKNLNAGAGRGEGADTENYSAPLPYVLCGLFVDFIRNVWKTLPKTFQIISRILYINCRQEFASLNQKVYVLSRHSCRIC